LLGLCLLLMTPLGANLLVGWLEATGTAPAACLAERARPLVMLTGGLDRPASNAQDFAALTEVSLHRVMALWASGEVLPNRAVVVSGGGQTPGLTESELARSLLIQLGAQPEQVQAETQSTSTWGNAVAIAHTLPAVKRLTLVTSAMHMRRARLAFAAQGIDVCPLPLDSRYVPPGGLGYYLPQSSALVKAEHAIHELVGLLSYQLKQGRTD
jgi:uncharacterized SAM-binding protein YcdF (DUF218 family)